MSDVETNLQPLLEDEGSEIATEEAVRLDTKLTLPPRRRGRRRAWLIGTVVAVVLLLAAGGALAYMRLTAQQQPQYTLATVTTGNLAVTVSGTGPIMPRAQYNLSFPSSVGGQISEIDVQVGQHVTKGQVLAKVDSPSLQDAVTQAQQAVNNAQTAYNDAVNSGASQSQLDQLQGQLQSAQDQLAAAQHNLSQTVLTAPSDGTIVAINGTVGQTPGTSSSSSGSSGSSGSNAFMVLVDTSSLTIAAAVNEADIASVQVGQPASFTVAAYPNRTFHATVSSVDILGQSSSNVVSYTVDLTVNQSSLNGSHIYPGMTATVNITTQQRIGALLVPNQALTFTNEAVQVGAISRQTLAQVYRNAGISVGQGNANSTGGTSASSQSSSGSSSSSSSSTRVVLTLRNGQLTPVVIQTGLTNGTYTEVTSGLQDGDQVVVSATGGLFSNLSTTSTSTGSSGLSGNGFGGGGARFFGGGGGGR
ncbi:efflux RND transporter periplasmic adaptor subunit [Thermogemmatispora carboxidivorans]|uniref:efflux RND transporter periplasmic adaptor subunit n=1 Tax=Thermogemmatispora carboxidivorans TaxID=1382306 RepID=UPI00069ABAA6|nr:efflux RND transporter periplasmic adaptor subunit [Thermogemmatispora carboxidivorans]